MLVIRATHTKRSSIVIGPGVQLHDYLTRELKKADVYEAEKETDSLVMRHLTRDQN